MKLINKLIEKLTLVENESELEDYESEPEYLSLVPTKKYGNFKIGKDEILCNKKTFNKFLTGLNAGHYFTDMPLISTDCYISSMIELTTRNECYKSIKIGVRQPQFSIMSGDLRYCIDGVTAVDINAVSTYNKLDSSERTYSMEFKTYQVVDIVGNLYTCMMDFEIDAAANVENLIAFENTMQKGLYKMFIEILTKYNPELALKQESIDVCKMKLRFDDVPGELSEYCTQDEQSMFRISKRFTCRLNTSLKGALGIEEGKR